MHIAEGILSPPVLAGGLALAAAGTAVGLQMMRAEDVPRTAVLTAAFFTASLFHLPLGPVSVHLVLNGLLGILLGWAAFPAILVGLVLQLVFFGHGGLTTLGVNTVNMALPAVCCHYLFARTCAQSLRAYAPVSGFAAGALAIALSGLLNSLALLTAGRAFWAVAAVVLGGHVPVMIVEGTVTAFAVAFLARVRPEILGPVSRPSGVEEGSVA